ncbi:MAG: tRNA pseudouridine(55) synthase TruB [bacterium]|nr:tRNA pseudouridine(55) synthase TruB [bacterium]
MFGFLNIDKPLGLTSHDVVARIRRVLKLKKVGHAGTLDPLASGVLVICVGGATRLSDYVMHSTKRYRARIHFGVTTTTYDAEGETVARAPADHLTESDIHAILPRFQGDIDQIPPMYSAIKQDGRKLYDLARSGVEIERPPRHITIHALDVIAWSPPEVVIDVTCSAGTYIRSLAFDMGQALGVGAHLSGLVRTRSGSFALEDAITLDALAASPAPELCLHTPAQALSDYPSLVLTAAQIDAVRHGRAVDLAVDAESGMRMGYNARGDLIAILEASGGVLKPSKVFVENIHDDV